MDRPTKRRRLDRVTSSGHQHDRPRFRNLVDEIDEGSSDATGSVEKLDSSKSASQQLRGNAPEHANHSIESAVCFGSILLSSAPAHITSRTKVFLGCRGLLSTERGDECSRLKPDDAKLLEALREEDIELELVYAPVDSTGNIKLWVTLYGSRELGESLGCWLQSFDIYFQDPKFAARDVPYLNPHRFGGKDGRTTDFVSNLTQAPQRRQQELSPTDLLAELVSEDSLPETEGHPYLQTALKSHQKRGLTFMLQRERGWKLSRNESDIWSIDIDPDGQEMFVNNITKSVQKEMPPQFRGGLLADTMGLGKSLSILSLIANDRLPSQRDTNLSDYKMLSMATLLVVPPMILRNWEDEISRHWAANHFSWRRHHGPYRLTHSQDIISHDLILVTYSTLAAEYRNKKGCSVLFTHKWDRVVLDEAHYIKNASSLTARAVFALKTDRRWAVTGTPFQNRLSELASLFQFLGAHPYSDRSTFDTHIRDVWDRGEKDEAISRLKKLLTFTMLRRTGDVIALPPRSDRRDLLRFGPKEQSYYNKAKERAIRCLDDVLSLDHPSNGYINALSKLTALRMICNLGCLANLDDFDARKPPPLEVLSDRTIWDSRAAKAALDDFPLFGIPYTCTNCQNGVDFSGEPAGEYPGAKSPFVTLARCFHLWCVTCSAELSTDASFEAYCHCEPPCPAVQFSLESLSHSSTPSPGLALRDLMRREKEEGYPTKIQALLQDLRAVGNAAKSIVFSFWKSTLDLVKIALAQEGISCVQIDGKVPSKRRAELLDEFTKTKNCVVLLLSLSCGAVGLTLTAASRVYLMEPQWNPSLEEQALARVHRIGQTKEVTTIRFVIDESIEKYILDIQSRKKDLSKVLFAPTGSSGSQLSQERLEQLRNLLT